MLRKLLKSRATGSQIPRTLKYWKMLESYGWPSGGPTASEAFRDYKEMAHFRDLALSY